MGELLITYAVIGLLTGLYCLMRLGHRFPRVADALARRAGIDISPGGVMVGVLLVGIVFWPLIFIRRDDQ